jgi:hypothetical protein
VQRCPPIVRMVSRQKMLQVGAGSTVWSFIPIRRCRRVTLTATSRGPMTRAPGQVSPTLAPLLSHRDRNRMTAPARPTPTRWFLASDPLIREGVATAAARWYWPNSTRTERLTLSGEWVDADLFRALHEDPGWVDSTEEEVNTWAVARKSNTSDQGHEVRTTSDAPERHR